MDLMALRFFYHGKLITNAWFLSINVQVIFNISCLSDKDLIMFFFALVGHPHIIVPSLSICMNEQ
jgi:hypothetical protein